ncbi:MAG: indole-3-glycerol phosphate synthase TrpC [Gemmatimonadales bacterium]
MPVSLEQILNSTRRQIPALRERRAVLEREASSAADPRPLEHALAGETVRVIAEVKRRSPSRGSIRDDLDPAAHAAAYAGAGAAAISVLTDGPFFGGSLDDLRAVAQRVHVPVLRKDFILDELQIIEARAAGASAVLLIVRALSRERLRVLLSCASERRLDALVEVHTRDELGVALESGARIVGVNSRDLDTFRIDTGKAWEIVSAVPPGVVAVAESGMASPADVERAAAAGADAVLVGTALSAATDPAPLLGAMTRIPRHAR